MKARRRREGVSEIVACTTIGACVVLMATLAGVGASYLLALALA